jgi:excisionase family DNA binding protein
MSTTRTKQQIANTLGILTPEQLAKELGVTVKTLLRWRLKRTAPPEVQVGRQRYFRRESVIDWLASRESRRVR